MIFDNSKTEKIYKEICTKYNCKFVIFENRPITLIDLINFEKNMINYIKKEKLNK